MAGPLNGIGQSPIPLANTFQPGKQDQQQVRERDSSRPANDTQASSAAANRTEDTQSRSPKNLQSLLKDAESTTQSDRGTVVDITV